MIQREIAVGTTMSKRGAEGTLLIGFLGIGLTLGLALLKAPSVSINHKNVIRFPIHCHTDIGLWVSYCRYCEWEDFLRQMSVSSKMVSADI